MIENILNFVHITDETYLRWFITALHFLWQGTVFAFVSFAGGRLLRSGAATLRYAFHVALLLCMPVCVAVTFSLVDVSFPTEGYEPRFRVERLASERVEPVRVFPATDPMVVRSPKTKVLAADSNSSNVQPSIVSPPSSLLIAKLARPAAAMYVLCECLLLSWLGTAFWGSYRLRATAQQLNDTRITSIVAEHARRVGLKLVPGVGHCERIAVPIVVGVLRPAIIIPTALIGLDSTHLTAILTHELAHIRRYDLLMNVVQRIVEAALFFHPATWYVSRCISTEREICCDNIVVATGQDRLCYAKALLDMADLCLGNTRAGVTSLAAIGDNASDLELRIRRLLDERPRSRLRLTRTGLCMTLLCIVLTVASAGAFHTTRTSIPFSESEAVGIVVTSDASHSERGKWGWSWKDTQVQRAKGRIHVPQGHYVGLQVSGKRVRDFSFLSQIPKDVLEAVVISDAVLGKTELQWITRQLKLKKLELRSCKMGPDGLQILSEHAPNLEHLYIDLREASSADAANISRSVSKMRQLSNLICVPQLDGVALKNLAGHPALASVNIKVDGDASEVFEALARLPKLSRLYVQVAEDPGQDAKRRLADLSVNHIQWFRGTVDRSLFDAFSQGGKLTKLELLSVRPGEGFLEGLKTLRSLEQLDLSQSDDGGVNSANLQAALVSLPRLRKWPRIADVNAGTLRAISTHQQIERLDITRVTDDVMHEDLEHISQLRNLRSLGLTSVNFNDDLAKRLANLRQLEELTLWNTGTTEQGLSALQAIPSLQRLRLYLDSPIRIDLSVLAEFPALDELELAGVLMQPAHIEPLRHCQLLRRLQLMGGVHVDDSTAEWIGKSKLVSLHLGESCVVTNRGAKALATLPTLQTLHVSGVINSGHVEALATNPSMRSLVVETQASSTDEATILSRRFGKLIGIQVRPFPNDTVGADGILRAGQGETRLRHDRLEGKPAPEFKSVDTVSRESVQLSNLRGKVVLLDLWGTWCDACKMSFPELRRLHGLYHKNGFEIIGVHNSTSSDDLPAFLEKNPLPWYNVVDSTDAIVDSYKVDAYPTYFLIDRRGNLRAAGVHSNGLEHGIRMLLKEIQVEKRQPHQTLESRGELKIGGQAPDIAALNLGGGTYNYKTAGKTVLLTFWSMKKQNYESLFKQLSRVRREFSTVPDFLMITVLKDEDCWEAWSDYCVQQGQVNYGTETPIRFIDDSRWWQVISMANGSGKKMLEEYGIGDVTPSSFLIAPNGELLERRIPLDKLEEVVSSHTTAR